MTPVFVKRIEDASGNVLEEARPDTARAIDGELAFKMNTLLKGVTTYGTAKEASRLGYPVAGKTGTTSSFFDALFVGYSPYVCTGVWVGFDQRASLGKKESGGRVALPIWMNFMANALTRYRRTIFRRLSPPASTGEPGRTPCSRLVRASISGRRTHRSFSCGLTRPTCRERSRPDLFCHE